MRATVLLLVLVPACSDGGGGDETEADLLAEVENDLDEYTTWDQAAGLEGVMDDETGFHGPFIQIWYNDAAIASLDTPADGHAAVKESYDDDAGATINAIAAMRYADGYGWFYAEVEPDGEIEESGRDDDCIVCHESNGANGFLAPGTL